MRDADDALETYLEQIVSGAPGPAPESALEPLLQVARQLHQVRGVEPSPAAIQRVRARLLRGSVNPSVDRRVEARGNFWRRPALALAFAVMLLTLGTTSVLAAPAALPDSPLYGVRNLREAVEVRLAGTPAQRAVLYANFAGERTAQLRTLAAQRNAPLDVVATLLRDISARVEQANHQANDDGPGSRSSVRQLEGEIGDQLTQIQQEGDFSGNAGDQLAATLRTVESGQSGDGNGNVNQP